jgi:hypothetical protein
MSMPVSRFALSMIVRPPDGKPRNYCNGIIRAKCSLMQKSDDICAKPPRPFRAGSFLSPSAFIRAILELSFLQNPRSVEVLPA